MKHIKDSRINRRVFLAMSCGFMINVAFGDSQDLHKSRVDSLKNARNIIVYYSSYPRNKAQFLLKIARFCVAIYGFFEILRYA